MSGNCCDNVDELNEIKSYFPEPNSNPHIILTSRKPQPGFQPVQIDLLNEDESLELLIKESGRKFTRYWVELKFETENKACEINEADYKYLLYNEFAREINKGDTLEVKGIENKIYYLKKNGKEYLNFRKARSYESKRSGILIYLYIFVLIFSVYINFLKKKPRIKFLNKIYAINIDILFIILLILNLIILEITVGLDYFFNTKHM